MQFTRKAKRTVYANPWISFEAHEILHPNGTPGEHGMLITPQASAVVVYDGNLVYFTRQARFAVDAVVLEIVKGGREPGETALDAARRETREEAGIEAARWDALGITYELPSIIAHPISLFLARDLTHVATELENVESIEIQALTLPAAVAAIYAGAIPDAVTGLAILRAAHLMAAEASSSASETAARR
jgi:8-oxo-dGTP pyrophosphatase MutT (NUDIX family)